MMKMIIIVPKIVKIISRHLLLIKIEINLLLETNLLYLKMTMMERATLIESIKAQSIQWLIKTPLN